MLQSHTIIPTPALSEKVVCSVCVVNFPPDYCPYCGTELDDADPDFIEGEARAVWHCPSCDDFVFDNPCPGGSVAIVDGDALLLVEDFRTENRWKLPSGRIEYGESPSDGAIRELEEETGLTVDGDALRWAYDSAGQPVEDMHMSNITFAVERSAVSGDLEAGDDAVDARFWTAEAFVNSDAAFTETHVDRFGTDSFEWLFETVADPLDG